MFIQEFSEDVRKRMDFEEISKILDLAIPPVSYRSQKELFLLLSKGILLSGGKSVIYFVNYVFF